MRTTTDALRSMARQADVVLNGGVAPLGEIQTTGTRWPTWRFTHGQIAPGCIEVSEAAWAWLRTRDLQPPVIVNLGGARWERRLWLWPATDAELAANGVVLPPDVAGHQDPGITKSLMPALPANPWEIRLAAERGETTYPFCRVSLPTGVAITWHSPHFYTATQPVNFECYPVELAADPEEALLLATDAIDTLTRGFMAEGVGLGRTARVPLFDYELVPLEQGVAARRLAPDFLTVQDWSARTLPDPTDLRRCAAIVETRVEWRVSVNRNRHRGTRLVDSIEVVTAGN